MPKKSKADFMASRLDMICIFVSGLNLKTIIKSRSRILDESLEQHHGES